MFFNFRIIKIFYKLKLPNHTTR